jgi:hypothetical protein
VSTDHPDLALELPVCGAYNIPYSEFLSWPEVDREIALRQYEKAIRRYLQGMW